MVPLAQGDDGGVGCCAFNAVVPAVVFTRAITVVFAIGVVFPVSVPHQVSQRKTIMGCYEIDAA